MLSRLKTVLLAAVLVGCSFASSFGQSGGTSGAGGAGGTSGTGGAGSTGTGSAATGSAPGTATPGSSVPSGTGPTPAPTPGQSFTFPSQSGAPGTGTTDNRVPSGTGPTPAPTPGQSTTTPPGQSTTTPPAPGSETGGANALTTPPREPGSETSSGPTAAQRRDCETAAERQARLTPGGTTLGTNTVGVGTTTGRTPRITEDPRVPKESRSRDDGTAAAGC